jgi:cytochrome c-type biogenesis protein CcmH/NrfF
MLRIAAILALLVAFGSVSASAEETPAESRQVQSIVRKTASPFCPGKTLDSCPSPKAGEWRRDIREWVGEGVSEPEIRDRLQARVPGFDLSIPPVKSGWVIPVIAVVLSTWWFVAMARRFRRRDTSGQEVEARMQDPTLDARLDEELALLDR